MIIVDASVAYKWIIHEPDEATSAALKLRDHLVRGDIRVIAPDLILYEVANILAYKSSLSRSDAEKAWSKFLLFPLSIVAATSSFVGECLVFARQGHVTVYDAAYVVLAKTKGCSLVTDDKQLVSRVKLPFVQLITSYDENLEKAS